MSQPNRIVVAVLCLASACLAAAQTVDCLAAVVNGQALTLTDVLIAQEFRLFPPAAEGTGAGPRQAVLDALIDQKVVLELSRESGPVDPARVEEALSAVREALGGEAFRKALGEFGLVEGDLRPYLEDRIRFEKAVAVRFAVRSPVSASDVEAYYRDVYVPERRRQGLEAEPLDDVRARIQASVEQAARAEKIAEWIKNLRRQADVRINRDCLERRKESP